MQHITVELEDSAFSHLSEEASRLNQSVDTYASTLLLAQIGKRNVDIRSPLESGIGMFADVPDTFEEVMNDIMESRSRRWEQT